MEINFIMAAQSIANDVKFLNTRCKYLNVKYSHKMYNEVAVDERKMMEGKELSF